MGCEFTSCQMEAPISFCDQLRAKLMVALLEEPAHKLTNIITRDQDYVVRVCVALGAQMKKLLHSEWCISVVAESFNHAQRLKLSAVIPTRNCNERPDCCDFKITADDFEPLSTDRGGELLHFVITVVARDTYEHNPIPIFGSCRIGPIIVY
jgi:hypothetical protein